MDASRKVKYFHVLGTHHCPWCVKLQGALMMHFHTVSQEKLDRHVCFHDRDTTEGRQTWEDEVGDIVPASHQTIPAIVAEYSDGKRKFIGGFDRFVAMFGGAK